jgi:4-amino-4-deoxy-L-arabinose transferase-like glycosyltransferase
MDFANRLDFASKGLLLGAGVIVALVGLTAVMAAPSMWDAMLSHLPRVTMWMSNRNVRFFPTPDYLQLVMAPWSEYTMMHTIMLWGSDRFVNLVQFFSYLGSIIGVSLIARQLGAGPRGQVLAAVVCATIPEGILEASGPMNTYVVSFWVTATVVFLLLWNEDTNWLNTICIGLAAGLAILTKGTAYIYLPFLVAACWLLGTRETRLLFLKRSPALVALILALNVAKYYRNYELTGSPLGVPLPESYPRAEATNTGIDLRGTTANIVRNLSVHMTTPSVAVNSQTERILRAGIELLGKDPDDPNSIWLDAKFKMNSCSDHEIYAGNPAHLVLFLVSLFLVLVKHPPNLSRKPIWYGLGVAASFVLLSAALRWSPYVSRYHLAWFVLGSPLYRAGA